jgi:hypothetical protein
MKHVLYTQLAIFNKVVLPAQVFKLLITPINDLHNEDHSKMLKLQSS